MAQVQIYQIYNFTSLYLLSDCDLLVELYKHKLKIEGI